jgi:hypothetical protein
MAHLTRVLNPRYLSAELSDHLVPVRDWVVPIGNMPERLWVRGNVFLVRQRFETHVLEATEGCGYVVVEVRRADGAALVPAGADLATFAVGAAGQWLSEGMQPKAAVNRVLPQFAPSVACWVTRDVADREDKTGFRFVTCQAYSDGQSLRYEVKGILERLALDQPPSPYAFGEPTPPGAPVEK